MRLILTGILMLTLCACSEKDLREAVEYINASADEVPLQEKEVVAALKDALSRGISRGAAFAARKGGYMNDTRLRIAVPPEAQKVEKMLRKLGFGSEVDRFVKQLNRSAELAAAEAKPIFIKAITSMSIDDAFDILNGERDAATRYLKRETEDDLQEAFLPVVRDALDETSATRYYTEIVTRFNNLSGTFDVDPDLDEYATQKAIDGLFVMIAREEAAIRSNPAARATKLLRRVFGSLD